MGIVFFSSLSLASNPDYIQQWWNRLDEMFRNSPSYQKAIKQAQPDSDQLEQPSHTLGGIDDRQTFFTVDGDDAKDVLLKQYPELNRYLQKIIDHIESLKITRAPTKKFKRKQNSGNSQTPAEGMTIDVWLDQPTLPIDFKSASEVSYLQPYAVDLDQHLRIQIVMHGDKIYLEKIEGIRILVKIPIIPDSFYPKKLMLDLTHEVLYMSAGILGDWITIVAKADVKGQKFDGVDWGATLFKNWPVMLGLLVFTIL
ncbi:MAG: hypothetical protein AB7F43_08450 [Bacteriovoracia bacterium]